MKDLSERLFDDSVLQNLNAQNALAFRLAYVCLQSGVATCCRPNYSVTQRPLSDQKEVLKEFVSKRLDCRAVTTLVGAPVAKETRALIVDALMRNHFFDSVDPKYVSELFYQPVLFGDKKPIEERHMAYDLEVMSLFPVELGPKIKERFVAYEPHLTKPFARTIRQYFG